MIFEGNRNDAGKFLHYVYSSPVVRKLCVNLNDSAVIPGSGQQVCIHMLG